MIYYNYLKEGGVFVDINKGDRKVGRHNRFPLDT